MLFWFTISFVAILKVLLPKSGASMFLFIVTELNDNHEFCGLTLEGIMQVTDCAKKFQRFVFKFLDIAVAAFCLGLV